ncbi:unnamed protein product [Arabidopsis halleri]
MTMMSDLPHDLLEEILSRVPLTCLSTVRSTCKTWNNLSKEQILCNAKERQQFMGFIRKDNRVCSLRFNLQGILQGEEFVDSSIKPVCNFIYQVKISKIVNCDGLLLCITSVNTEIRVWNPYLGQMRWIKPIKADMTGVKYALGYDDNKNRNHKILRALYDYFYRGKSIIRYEIYDFKSNSWRVLDILPDWDIKFHGHGVSLKGNTYFVTSGRKKWTNPAVSEDFLFCFDFTKERFGPHLPLPFYYDVSDIVGLSSVKEEQLAVLYVSFNTFVIEIWTTTKIEPNVVSWIPFLKVDNSDLKSKIDVRSLFIDQEKKLAVVFKSRGYKSRKNKAYVFGENGYMKKVGLREAVGALPYCRPRWCSYVPSLVQINQSSNVVQQERRRLFMCLLNRLPFILLLGFLLLFCRFLLM